HNIVRANLKRDENATNPIISNITTVVHDDADLKDAGGLALDFVNNRMYATANNLVRFNLDGTGKQVLITGFTISPPVGVALDLMGGRLYMTHDRLRAIDVRDLDGKTIGTL